jgi:hypothetical protein
MRWRIATTLGLASTALVVGTAQGSASQAATWYSSLPMSSSLSTPAQVTGTLRDAQNAVLPGQPVVLIVQPTDDQMPTGTPVAMAPVSQGYTDDSGRFSLTVPDPSALVPDAAPGGLVDFVVYAPGSAARPFYFSRRLTLDTDGYALVSPGSPPSTVNTGATRARSTAASTHVPVPPVAAPSPEAGGGTCTKTKLKELPSRVGIVGQWYSTLGKASHWRSSDKGSAVWSEFDYGEGAGSSIGVAVSDSGKYGSFSQSGTKSKDAAGTVGFGHDYNDGGWLHQTYFDSARYRSTCPETSWYTVEPDGWRGGSDPDSRIAAPIPSNTNDHDHCDPYGAGASYTQDTSSAVTWTNGYDLLGPIGIDVSIQTGYNNNASLKVHFHTNAWLCGRGSLPRDHPRVLVARRYP